MSYVTLHARRMRSGAAVGRSVVARWPTWRLGWTALVAIGVTVSLVALARPVAGIVCSALGTIALLSVAVRLAIGAQAAYKALSRAHEDLRRYGERVEATTISFEHKRRAFEARDALHRDVTSVLAQIKAILCVIGPGDAEANAHLSNAQRSAVHILGDIRRRVRC
jgi:hypothetical protein